jgi:hypothetical protein
MKINKYIHTYIFVPNQNRSRDCIIPAIPYSLLLTCSRFLAERKLTGAKGAQDKRNELSVDI